MVFEDFFTTATILTIAGVTSTISVQLYQLDRQRKKDKIAAEKARIQEKQDLIDCIHKLIKQAAEEQLLRLEDRLKVFELSGRVNTDDIAAISKELETVREDIIRMEREGTVADSKEIDSLKHR